MRSVLLCIGAMLGSLNVFASSSRQQTHLVLDEQKLQDLMKAFDLPSGTDSLSFVEVDSSNQNDIATPEDVSNGNYELQCKTTCEFKKKAVAFSVDMNSPITAVLEGSAAASKANADGPSNSDSVSEGAMIKAAANAVAKKQQRLQHIRSLIKSSPDDAALQTHETTLQLDISRMLHKMLGKAGVAIKLKSEPLRLEKAIVLCKKRVNLLQETLRTDDNKAIRDELVQLQQLTAALQQASVDADNLVAAGLDMQLQALQERLTELQNERKEKPKPDEDLEGAIKKVKDAIQTKTDNSFIPVKECYRVCTNPSAPVHSGDIQQCVKMCVKLMKHVVHHVSKTIVQS